GVGGRRWGGPGGGTPGPPPGPRVGVEGGRGAAPGDAQPLAGVLGAEEVPRDVDAQGADAPPADLPGDAVLEAPGQGGVKVLLEALLHGGQVEASGAGVAGALAEGGPAGAGVHGGDPLAVDRLAQLAVAADQQVPRRVNGRSIIGHSGSSKAWGGGSLSPGQKPRARQKTGMIAAGHAKTPPHGFT